MTTLNKRRRSKVPVPIINGVKCRSVYESEIAAQLNAAGVDWKYESESFKYKVPDSKYTPDFILTNADGSKTYIEVKGFLDYHSRQQMTLIKKQYPHLDLRFHFMRPKNRINGRKSSTYEEWAVKHGFKLWNVPQEK